MKILKLSAYCPPEKESSSHLTEDLNRAYLQAGFTIENFVPTPTRGINDEVRKQYKKIKYEELEGGKRRIRRGRRQQVIQPLPLWKRQGCKEPDNQTSGKDNRTCSD